MTVGGNGNVCGIAGMWGTSDDISVRQMMDALIHRGPDDAGTLPILRDFWSFGTFRTYPPILSAQKHAQIQHGGA